MENKLQSENMKERQGDQGGEIIKYFNFLYFFLNRHAYRRANTNINNNDDNGLKGRNTLTSERCCLYVDIEMPNP